MLRRSLNSRRTRLGRPRRLSLAPGQLALRPAAPAQAGAIAASTAGASAHAQFIPGQLAQLRAASAAGRAATYTPGATHISTDEMALRRIFLHPSDYVGSGPCWHQRRRNCASKIFSLFGAVMCLDACFEFRVIWSSQQHSALIAVLNIAHSFFVDASPAVRRRRLLGPSSKVQPRPLRTSPVWGSLF